MTPAGRALRRRSRRSRPPTRRARMPATMLHGRNAWPESAPSPRSCGDFHMSELAGKKLSRDEVAELRKLRLEALNLQEIQGGRLRLVKSKSVGPAFAGQAAVIMSPTCT